VELKLGDKVWGYCRARRKMVFITIDNIFLDQNIAYGSGDSKINEGFCGPIPFSTIVSDEIYNSPLYKALNEEVY
jgi:hypothetical protein